MKKNLTIRIPEEHPIWQESEKTKVILDALELYYATKAVVSGTIKLKTIQIDNTEQNKQQLETGLGLDKKSVKSLLDAFSKL
ncbi:hypothetical protein OTK01_000315 [Caldicellulosiruptor acetigenus]|uniref:hypothetical protein n=1 Tax=Caldicellulosiruptor acetigenus TaxID=301953 RepID=UPI0022A956A5|nr:hypothetical protein [Caldicellulosiruptor acetigenus]WAM36541.1 hypothetical protein OTK01_000315 [Caldicellulosiruptor acetigenus]